MVSALAATIFASAYASASAQPGGLNYACQREYRKYQLKPGPKAFAVDAYGHCGWAWRKKSSASEMQAAKRNALGYCLQGSEGPCKVAESVF